MQSLPQSHCTEGEPAVALYHCPSPQPGSPHSTTIIPCCTLSGAFFCVWWRHPSDSHLHVGVIINGLYLFQESSACSLLPCVHSKHQFNVLQKITLHISINVLCVFHGHALAPNCVRMGTKSTVKMWPCPPVMPI